MANPKISAWLLIYRASQNLASADTKENSALATSVQRGKRKLCVVLTKSSQSPPAAIKTASQSPQSTTMRVFMRYESRLRSELLNLAWLGHRPPFQRAEMRSIRSLPHA